MDAKTLHKKLKLKISYSTLLRRREKLGVGEFKKINDTSPNFGWFLSEEDTKLILNHHNGKTNAKSTNSVKS